MKANKNTNGINKGNSFEVNAILSCKHCGSRESFSPEHAPIDDKSGKSFCICKECRKLGLK